MLLVKSRELRNSNKRPKMVEHMATRIWLMLLFIAMPMMSVAQAVAATTGLAAQPSTAVNPGSATPLQSPGSWLSALLSLLLVIAVIVGLGWMMKRLNVTKTGSAQMQVVASMMTGPRERIMVIQIGAEQHVIGITAHNINHLAKLEQPLSIEQPGEVFRSKFNELLQKPRDGKQSG